MSKNKLFIILSVFAVIIPIAFQNKEAAIGLGIVALLMLLIEKSKSSVYLFVIVAILGSLAEAIFIYFGVWHYAHPNFIGIPMWLPLLWGNAGLAINRLSKVL